MHSPNYLRFAVSLSLGVLLLWSSSIAALAQTKQNPRRSLIRSTELPVPVAVEPCFQLSSREWFLRERIVFLSGVIDTQLSERVIAQLIELDAQAPGQDIYLYINSVGGKVEAGLAIFDVMRALRSDVVTVTLGEASSMASFLLAGGAKGKRFVLPNTRIMIHQPSTSAFGTASDVAIVAKEIEYLKTKLNRMLAEMTGQTVQRIEVDTNRDLFMSAQEAKAYGLVDQVVKRLPSASNPTGK